MANGLYETFRVVVQGGTDLLELQGALSSFYDGGVVVTVDTDTTEISYKLVVERLESMGLLHQMTLDQRDRAYKTVLQHYNTADYNEYIIDDILSNNWTDVVFGEGE